MLDRWKGVSAGSTNQQLPRDYGTLQQQERAAATGIRTTASQTDLRNSSISAGELSEASFPSCRGIPQTSVWFPASSLVDRIVPMKFTKMHGAGNDYVYVDCFREQLPEDLPELARQMSHRHFGIGADGLILIRPSKLGDARMQMFNADGSESEMCGNGIRCVAKYVYDHGIAAKPSLAIETGAGVLEIEMKERASLLAGAYA